MPVTILQITRSGDIAQRVEGFEESVTLQYTVTVDVKTVTLGETSTVTLAAWAWGSDNPLPCPYFTTMAGTRGLLVCKSCSLNRKESDPVHWYYSVMFDNKSMSQQESEKIANPNPIDRRPRVNRSTQMIEMPVEKDRNGKPLLNTAKQKPLDPLMLATPHDTLNVEVFYGAWPVFYNTLGLKRSINETAVTVRGAPFAAKTLWFHPLGIDDGRTENGTFYYTVRFALVVALETWPEKVKRLSIGYEHLVEDPDNAGEYLLQKIKLPNGEEPREPLLLDETGFCPFPQMDTFAAWLDSDVFEEVEFLTAGPGGTPLPGLD